MMFFDNNRRAYFDIIKSPIALTCGSLNYMAAEQ